MRRHAGIRMGKMKEKEMLAATAAGTIAIGALLWTQTTMDIIEVGFGAITGGLAVCGIAYMTITLLKERIRRKHREEEQKRLEAEQKRNSFHTYRFEPDLIKVQTGKDKDMYEWLNAWKAVEE